MTMTMTITWLVIAMLVILHTVWTFANALTNYSQIVKGTFTPHKTLPYVWGGVLVIALVQIAYILIAN
jgi:hypothetical protein